MNNKKYEKVLPFICECVFSLIVYFFTIIFIIWTKFQFPLLNIFFLISSLYDVKFFIILFNIIRDVKSNNIVTEYLYISFVKKSKFDFLFLKKYVQIQCHKVKGRKYTNEIIYLKSSKNINFKEKSFVKISYYQNCKIINCMSLEKRKDSSDFLPSQNS